LAFEDDQLENNDQQQVNAQRRSNNRNSTRGSRGGFGRGSRGGFERSERGERGVERQNGRGDGRSHNRGDRVERHREIEPRASNESDLIDERSIETVDPSLDSNATSNTLSKEHESKRIQLFYFGEKNPI